MARTRISQAQNNIGLNRQNITTNVTQNGAFMQSGWGFILGDGTHDYLGNATITFPVPYTSAPVVSISAIGFKDASDPTAISDTTVWPTLNMAGGNITTTGIQVSGQRVDGAAIPSNRRCVFSWVALGT